MSALSPLRATSALSPLRATTATPSPATRAVRATGAAPVGQATPASQVAPASEAVPAPTPASPIVAIGIGNTLRGDDGVGVRVIDELALAAAHDPSSLPAGVRLIDGGIRGIDLVGAMSAGQFLLLVDALDLGLRPGTVEVLRGDAIAAASNGAPSSGPPSVGSAVQGLLEAARLMGRLPRAVTLIGIQVGTTEIGAGLSPQVTAAVPAAVDAVRRELWAAATRSQRGARPVTRDGTPVPAPGEAMP